MSKKTTKYLMASYKSDHGVIMPGASIADKSIKFVDLEVIETDDSTHIAAVRSRMMRKNAAIKGVLIISFENMRNLSKLFYQHV